MMDWVRGKARAEDYLLSEHVVRSLMTREVDSQEIAEALSGGRIIEDHYHPQRAPAFLILGPGRGRHLHLLCSRLEQQYLVVLFAYQPRPPLWDGPARRGGNMDLRQDAPLQRCFFCGGAIKEIVVGNFDYRLEGRLYVIKNTPAGLCEQCGEKYVSATVAKGISQKVAQGDFQGKEEVMVLDFPAVDQL